MTFKLKEEIDKFMTGFTGGKLEEPEYSEGFDKFSNKNKIVLISCLIQQASPCPMNDTTNKNFKMEYYYALFEFIVNNFNKIYLSTNLLDNERVQLDNILIDTLLEKLTRLFKGQNLLNKLNHRINKIIKNEDKIINMLETASSSGTFITFLFWLNKTKTKTLESIKKEYLDTIYVYSIGNSDDRLFKYILNHIEKHDKLFFQKNQNVIDKLLEKLACSLVPLKYQLKRIKLLSQQISLIPYFNFMIKVFNPGKIIIELHKYYYVEPHDFDSIDELIQKLINYGTNGLEIKYEKLMSFMALLKTEEEKISCQIIVSLLTYNNFDFKVSNMATMEKVIINNYSSIIKEINWESMIRTLDNINFNKLILQILIDNNLITKWVIKNKHTYIHNYKILLFTRFLPVVNYSNDSALANTIISVNLFLHKLRLVVKKKSKSKIIQRKVKLFDLLNEINNFTPNKYIPILAKGSNIYQQQKQKFTNQPPRHLLPGELAIYKHFLLKEKADGILINNLPIGIYPQSSILSNYLVKAEYIEDLDLYLVFDINIPNTTIIERYNILRQTHLYTLNTHLESINNLDDLFKLIDKERVLIKKFIKENHQHSIKWYPKFACQYNHSSDKTIYNQLINEIILEKNQEINCKLKSSELYNCDGLILTPLDGEREIKIKPKSQITIDLLFDGIKWIDRNNNDWTPMIIKPKKAKKEGCIYRCYPRSDSIVQFTVEEYRYDKKNPNPYNIVDCVVNMLKYNWENDLNDMDSYYYDESKPIRSVNLIQTIRAQNELLEQRIETMEPSFNKNWLDLGCGKGKLVPVIKKYNPKTYLGLDIDIKQLVRALKFHDENQNVYQFNPCDLSTNWELSKNKWSSFNTRIKYDYIIANFSLMHFCTDEFWSQLNDIVHDETKFMFNLVKPNSSNEWKESESFLKIEDSIVNYKFEWAHQNIKTEPLISDEHINNYLKKFGWKVLDTKPVNSPHTLLTFYGWWVIQKYYK
jgi:SAM-dependent methyltransferase